MNCQQIESMLPSFVDGVAAAGDRRLVEAHLAACPACRALAEAQSLALGRDHNFILPAHLLLVLLDQKGGTVRPLLLKCAVDVKTQ